MTEKELKKLNRLELLELLLEVSKENQELKGRIDKLNNEIDTAQKLEYLSNAIVQVESALKHADRLTATMKASGYNPDQSAVNSADEQQPSLLDKEIYRCLLHFYSENNEALSTLPLELQIAVQERVKAY